MNKYYLNYLEQLEARGIYIMREVAAQFEKPALLLAEEKDSITLVQLAKSFCSRQFPFHWFTLIPGIILKSIGLSR